MGGHEPDRPRVTRELARFTGFGLSWALSVLLFLMLGYWLDGLWGTLPWLTILGAFVGASGGFLSLYRGLTAAAAEEERERHERKRRDRERTDPRGPRRGPRDDGRDGG